MKKIVFAACLFSFLVCFSAFAQSSYSVNFSNPSKSDSNSFEFDLSIKSTGTNFLLTSYQCAFTFNIGNSNGGSLTFSYIQNTSELTNIPLFKIGINSIDNVPKLTFASSAGSDSIKTSGKRIGRFRIKSSRAFTSNVFGVNWSFTGISATIITGNNFSDITNSAYHSNLSFTYTDNQKLNATLYPLASNDDGYLFYSRQETYATTEYSNMGNNNNGYRISLIRFPNSGTVAGKIIDSAFVYFTAWGNTANTVVNLRVSANDTVNAKPIGASCPAELGRVLTTAKVDWNGIPAWQDGKIYKSPNLKTVVQEWADIPNHKTADALMLFFNNNGSSANAYRAFSQWDYQPAGGTVGQERSKLVIYYHAPLQKIAEEKEIVTLPTSYVLSQNYPNPFNPSTTIQYQIPQDGYVTLKVYDILGKEVATLVDEEKSTGMYSTDFDASNLASGTYVYQIRINNFVSTKKMMLLK